MAGIGYINLRTNDSSGVMFFIKFVLCSLTKDNCKDNKIIYFTKILEDNC